MLNKSIEQAI